MAVNRSDNSQSFEEEKENWCIVSLSGWVPLLALTSDGVAGENGAKIESSGRKPSSSRLLPVAVPFSGFSGHRNIHQRPFRQVDDVQILSPGLAVDAFCLRRRNPKKLQESAVEGR